MTLTSSLSSIPLRWSMAADAAVCAVTGLLVLLLAEPIARWTDLPVALLRVGGLLLVPYVIFLAIALRRETISRSAASIAIGVNIAWAVGCVAVLLSNRADPNALGVTFALVQAVGVLALAVVQRAGMR
jgi:hypothetical protein